jgi:hypothetical protein
MLWLNNLFKVIRVSTEPEKTKGHRNDDVTALDQGQRPMVSPTSMPMSIIFLSVSRTWIGRKELKQMVRRNGRSVYQMSLSKAWHRNSRAS